MFSCEFYKFLTLFRMGLFGGCSQIGGERPPSVAHSLNSADIIIFSLEISNFCYIKKHRCRLYFSTQFLILLTLLQYLKLVLINMVAILIMSAKLASLGLLEIKLFWNKGYDATISVHHFIRKIFSRDSNYIIDVVMRPTFCNSSTYVRQVVITSIL